MTKSKKDVIEVINTARRESSLKDVLKTEFSQYQDSLKACKGSKWKQNRFHVDGFDSEQIWHQLRMCSREVLPLVTDALDEKDFDHVQRDFDLTYPPNSLIGDASETKEKPPRNLSVSEMNKFLDDFEKLDEEPIDQLYESDHSSEPSDADELYEDPVAKQLLDEMEEQYMVDDEHPASAEKPKSKFENENEQVSKQIKRLEERNIKEKPWFLQGEAQAKSRPAGSLLERFVDFQQDLNVPPIITEETTDFIEKVIKRRIKDKLWDDVVRKTKPEKNNTTLKLPGVLDSEKGKESLSTIYENERMGNNSGQTDVDTHKDLRIMLNNVLNKIDALCNLSYGVTSMQHVKEEIVKETKPSRKRK